MTGWTLVEEQLQARFPGTEILIHVDPEGPDRPRNPSILGFD